MKQLSLFPGIDVRFPLLMVYILVFADLVTNNEGNNLTVKEVVIDTAISAGVQYTLNLKPYGNTTDITKQATSAASSVIINNSRSSVLLYQYSSAVKGGSDEVILGVSSGAKPGNGCTNIDSTVIKINLTVK